MGRNQGESWQDYAGRLEVENADLRERVATLEDMVNRLLKRVDELERAGKRQASPFSKGDPKEKPKKPGRKKGGKCGMKYVIEFTKDFKRFMFFRIKINSNF